MVSKEAENFAWLEEEYHGKWSLASPSDRAGRRCCHQPVLREGPWASLHTPPPTHLQGGLRCASLMGLLKEDVRKQTHQTLSGIRHPVKPL